MADIELVVKIPEETYEYWKNWCHSNEYVLAETIKNGIPLPKGHGRLIDADELNKSLREQQKSYKQINEALKDGIIITEFNIDLAPTVIEADKENDNTRPYYANEWN